MTIDPSHLEIEHNIEDHRFEIRLGENVAYAEYRIRDDKILIMHVQVPPAFEGKGIGGRLARFILDYAQTEGYRVRPLCSFMAGYIERHPEYHAITDDD